MACRSDLTLLIAIYRLLRLLAIAVYLILRLIPSIRQKLVTPRGHRTCNTGRNLMPHSPHVANALSLKDCASSGFLCHTRSSTMTQP
ncbi:hypothetical protein ElyMa_006880300 [Elysia marginata]|uniref:Secreted protein n=1 Tax=Elysia marginata TaxID=1093978 RepID=A0AAV4JE57_9GAST|nr:hypothetical protein ElyMa_006880300 [Elysia marginata]